ncbi:hypothetical protein [Anoxybacteroides amylolyticum]|uniref:Uncharacterized protein n=1 Tax=Anoxybacteroides amylolyticum TaxID=294699 RepID=A0A167TL44_9BACL|nr:hypothetical protein [Anoxybacillus amylolyticus]ANB61290.1 hypothetical protein GFC30_2787 [Anoxybacillus amylolyticus]
MVKQAQGTLEVRRLLKQAKYFKQLADQMDGHPRLEVIRRLEE